MENIFFSDLNGPFDIEDLLPDDPWIDINTALPVQNIEIPEPRVTAREVLEETILSPAATENLLGTNEEFGQFFPEQFIKLADIESDTNSLYNHPTHLATYNDMSNVFDDFLADYKMEAALQNSFPTEKVIHENALQVEPAYTPENLVPDDSLAVVPDVIPETSPTPPESPADVTDSGVFANNFPVDFSLDLDKLDPAIVALLENLEKSIPVQTQPKSRKRVHSVNDDSDDPTTKKKKPPTGSSTDNETIPDKIVERRIKNNAASRVCRATRKERHQDLFKMEKDLVKENKELSSKVEELSATVEYLRGYLVSKLSGRCN